MQVSKNYRMSEKMNSVSTEKGVGDSEAVTFEICFDFILCLFSPELLSIPNEFLYILSICYMLSIQTNSFVSRTLNHFQRLPEYLGIFCIPNESLFTFKRTDETWGLTKLPINIFSAVLSRGGSNVQCLYWGKIDHFFKTNAL